MTEKEFLQEIDKAKEEKKNYFEKIKSHGLPVIIFGAGVYASVLTKVLERNGVKIFGYAVDKEYYQPEQTYFGLPIFNFDEISNEPDKYVFIFGMAVDFDRNKLPVYLKRKKRFIEDENIIKYCLISDKGCRRMDYDFVADNKSKFLETYNLLEDDLSRQTMMYFLKKHISGVPTYFPEVIVPNEHYNDLTATPFTSDTFKGYVDCGAYTGDTLKNFVEWRNGDYEHIFAFEPDKKNFDDLKKFVQKNGYKNVSLVNLGVWDKKDVLTFDSNGNMASRITKLGDISVEVDAIDNIVGNTPISLIKMDVEGSELCALQGAVKTMEHSKPVLSICLYHKKEDLITIPQFIKSVCKDYRFYLRKYFYCEDFDRGYIKDDLYELVLIALPN